MIKVKYLKGGWVDSWVITVFGWSLCFHAFKDRHHPGVYRNNKKWIVYREKDEPTN